jgi:hypothetical protein
MSGSTSNATRCGMHVQPNNPVQKGRTAMSANATVEPLRSNEYPIPQMMKAWVLGNPEELSLVDKPVPEPGPAERRAADSGRDEGARA